MTECGTPQGYKDGCRGANCANHRTDLMTCTQANIRYQSDNTYRKQVDAGTATAEREVFVEPVKAKAVRTSTAVPPRLKRPMLAHEHGTAYGYALGCRKTYPCPKGRNGKTCTQAQAVAQQESRARRRERDLDAERVRNASARPIEGEAA
jgi:hypothetical protein